MIRDVIKRAQERMDAAIQVLMREFAGLRSGRASLALLDGIRVEYYGSQMPLNQVATLSVPEARLIIIQPWDPKLIGEIEKAILRSDLGLTPANDGKVIRLPIPTLTEDRRKQIAKHARKLAEDARVAVRNVRRDGNEELKRLEKESHLSEDDVRKATQELQKVTDDHTKKIDDLLSHKEAEIMEV
ncbi:MAG: ribosome recycling factor [Nitrospirae bacterium]|nr:ribosome recycling factor [Nitrospirota bacterium]